jgi:hypothetical protein
MKVVEMDLWPSMSATSLNDAPEFTIFVAAVWRSLWSSQLGRDIPSQKASRNEKHAYTEKRSGGEGEGATHDKETKSPPRWLPDCLSRWEWAVLRWRPSKAGSDYVE